MVLIMVDSIFLSKKSSIIRATAEEQHEGTDSVRGCFNENWHMVEEEN